MIVLSYLGILALIPLLVEKEDREVQWHAKHGLVLLVTEIVLFVVLTIVMAIIGRIPCLGAIIGMLLWAIVCIGILIVHIMCIIKGVNGQRFTLPVISDYANKF